MKAINIDDIIDTCDVFNPLEWIAKGKMFSDELPSFVRHAANIATAIPSEFQDKFPPNSMPILEFLALRLPQQNQSIVNVSAAKWFSNNEPDTPASVVYTRDLPPSTILLELRNSLYQAWMDGSKSVADPRYNDGKSHLPLWVVPFWAQMSSILSQRKAWEASLRWLEEMVAGKDGPQVVNAAKEALDTMARLGNNTYLKYRRGTVQVLSCTTLLGNAWLNDDIVSVIAEDLANIAPKGILVVDWYFPWSLERRGTFGLSDTLASVAQKITTHRPRKMFFPTHIHGMHWITGFVDFQERKVGYGDPLNMPPARVFDILCLWLTELTHQTFTNEQNTLPCCPQKDSFNCGMIMLNTLRNQVQGIALWTQYDHSDITLCRVSTFLTIVDGQEPPGGSPLFNKTVGINKNKSVIKREPSDEKKELPKAEPSDGKKEQPKAENNHILLQLRPWVPQKRKEGDLERDLDPSRVTSDDERPKKRIGKGQSRSAIFARERKEAYQNGTLSITDHRVEQWKESLRKGDPHVEFILGDLCSARHTSGCGKFVRVKGPLDRSRWNQHLEKCSAKSRQKSKTANTPTLLSTGFLRSKDGHTGTRPQPVITSKSLCNGLSKKHDPRIQVLLERVSGSGGGGSDMRDIAKQEYEKPLKGLNEKERKRVERLQTLSHRWKYDHKAMRIYSAACDKMIDTHEEAPTCSHCLDVLALAVFRRALRKEKPNALNMKFVNNVYRNEMVGKLYAEIHGLRDLIERSEEPLVKYAKGALSGKYKDELFSGLIQVMVQKEERLEKGLSLRNFKYSPPWDELCHIIRTYSPAAYRALKEHLPARSERSIRTKEARDPKFPLGITDQAFELVEEHLQQLAYTGPVCVACDDTVLLSTFRLYWDASRQSHFLIGGVDGPIQVADPDNLRSILEQQESRKATKLRLWTITLSRPRTTPLAIAALPIPNSVSAEVLADYSLQILRGLIQHNIQVVSYACDGAAVERKAQDIITERAETRIHYRIENPRQSNESVSITIPVISGQPVAMIQDSKHALKTLRNNLFSGARLLVLGSHIASYSHIRDVAFAPDSPLYRRDVERLDRQDDNAATRLFSADTLKFICSNDNLRDNMLADIIYLFVCGDAIDGYQSRSTTHEERIQSLLRLRFFINAWLTTLSATNYSHRVHAISHEALKITSTLVEGYLSLVFIYRDFIHTAEPLMPWLHSTEACEHTFGQARQIIPNFSYADFLHLASKLRVHLRQENLRVERDIVKSKLPATGYSHTYFLTGGLDLAKLSVFPTNLQIDGTVIIALDEVDNLLSILGVNVRRLRSRYARHPLPSIRSWFPDAEKDETITDLNNEVNDQEGFETAHLLSLVTCANDPKRSLLPLKKENELTSLTNAALALVTHDVLKVYELSDKLTAEMAEFIADERRELDQFAAAKQLQPCNLNESFLPLIPNVGSVDEPTRPLGQSDVLLKDLDFTHFYEMRYQHQPDHAKHCARRSRGGNKESSSRTIHQELIGKLYEVMRDVQPGSAAGTNRIERWTGNPGYVRTAPQTSFPITGNAANAAYVSSDAANNVARRREQVFREHNVPHLQLLATGAITVHRNLRCGDYGFLLFDNEIRIGKVLFFYSKSLGKGANHSLVTEAVSNVSSLSRIAFQVFEYSRGNQFTSCSETTAAFGIAQFGFVTPHHLLTLLTLPPRSINEVGLMVESIDLQVFHSINHGLRGISAAVAQLTK